MSFLLFDYNTITNGFQCDFIFLTRQTIFLHCFLINKMLILPYKRKVKLVTREEYLKKLIKDNGFTIKDFSLSIDMPYSTLLTMLNDGKLGNAALDSVIRICKGLNITIEELQAVQKNTATPAEHLILSSHEKRMLAYYRQKTDLQKAVDLILFTESNN